MPPSPGFARPETAHHSHAAGRPPRRVAQRRRLAYAGGGPLSPGEVQVREQLDAWFDAAIVSPSPVARVRDAIVAAAGHARPVLVVGPAGVGKALVAQAIRRGGPRWDRPFVEVDCAALSADTGGSELFGNLLGSLGHVLAADHGTLYLDQVAELSTGLQRMLLTLMQTGTVRPVGALRSHPVDVRIIASSRTSLRDAVRVRRFLPELRAALDIDVVDVPTVQDLGSEIAALAAGLLDRTAAQLGLGPASLTPAAAIALAAQAWPGNVRELALTLTEAAVRVAGRAAQRPIEITADDLRIRRISLAEAKAIAAAAFELAYLERVLRLAGRRRR